MQTTCGFLVAGTMSDELEYFQLACAQGFCSWLLHLAQKTGSNLGGECRFALSHGTNSREKLFAWAIFEQVSGCTRLNSTQDIGVTIIGSQHQYWQCGEARSDLFDGSWTIDT